MAKNAVDDIEADFEILEAIGGHIETLIGRIMRRGVIDKTLRRWLVGHAHLPEEEDAQDCLALLAADLEMFAPSASNRTMVDRYLKDTTPQDADEQQAFKALAGAQFYLVRIVDREGPDCVRLQDLVTGEDIVLLDSRISAIAAGLPTAMRLCPLESGRYVLISALFAMDEEMLDEAMTFVRHGRPLGTGHRCAASLYRAVARRGFQPIPRLDVGELDGGELDVGELDVDELDEESILDFLDAIEDFLSPVQNLAVRWSGLDDDSELVFEARQLTSIDNLVDALSCYAEADEGGAPDGMLDVFEQIAALQVETIAGRVRAGIYGAANMLDQVADELGEHIAQGQIGPVAGDLFDRLRQRDAFSGSAFGAKKPAENASAAAEIDRVIQRIQALRARTAERGCTEAEAIAAAAKVSELLARHDLTLDEISVRQSDCEGVSVATGRKRSAPVDACVEFVAKFCDCRVWGEQRAEGLGFVFFGLRTDVEAARFLYDLIGVTFDTESATFRRGAIYTARRGNDRRVALNSFQTGLANGISCKLAEIKTARQKGEGQGTGFDLVTVKHAVLDDEIDRLGLDFRSRAMPSPRKVHGDAYHAGVIAGALFEPDAVLGS